jgi:hypothetical protein
MFILDRHTNHDAYDLCRLVNKIHDRIIFYRMHFCWLLFLFSHHDKTCRCPNDGEKNIETLNLMSSNITMCWTRPYRSIHCLVNEILFNGKSFSFSCWRSYCSFEYKSYFKFYYSIINSLHMNFFILDSLCVRFDCR